MVDPTRRCADDAALEEWMSETPGAVTGGVCTLLRLEGLADLGPLLVIAFGLKYATGFHTSHLGFVGRAMPPADG